MKKSFLIIIILIAFANFSKGQIGFFGKRLVVKANAISGNERLFSGFELEYAVKRNITVCFGYRANSYESTFNFSDFESINYFINNVSNYQIYNFDDGLKFYDLTYSLSNTEKVESGFKNKVQDGRLVSNRRIFDFSFRFYSNSYLSAPSGFYSQFGLGFGSQTYNGGIYYPDDIREYENTSKIYFYNESFERYEKKETVFNLYFGLGYQHIFSKWVTLDFNINAGAGVIGNSNTSGFYKSSQNNFSIILDEQEELLRIGNLYGNARRSIYLSPLSTFYFSGNVKLGILLF